MKRCEKNISHIGNSEEKRKGDFSHPFFLALAIIFMIASCTCLAVSSSERPLSVQAFCTDFTVWIPCQTVNPLARNFVASEIPSVRVRNPDTVIGLHNKNNIVIPPSYLFIKIIYQFTSLNLR